jgi:hypothetical protein
MSLARRAIAVALAFVFGFIIVSVSLWLYDGAKEPAASVEKRYGESNSPSTFVT